jgi:hypothetical protein
MVTTTNLNQGSDYWINMDSYAASPLGAETNKFIAIQQTFEETLDFNFI